MSVEWSRGIEEIKFNDCESIILERKSQEVYEWVEVSYKNGEELIVIGSYYTYDMNLSRGWMKFNDETIAIAKEYIPTYCIDGIQVEVIFDIRTKSFIEGSKDDLLTYYKEQFISKEETKYNVSLEKNLKLKSNI